MEHNFTDDVRDERKLYQEKICRLLINKQFKKRNTK